MGRVNIVRKDGTPTPYFWSDNNRGDRTQKTIYKQTDGGVKRMTGVHFDATTKRVVKE